MTPEKMKQLIQRSKQNQTPKKITRPRSRNWNPDRGNAVSIRPDWWDEYIQEYYQQQGEDK